MENQPTRRHFIIVAAFTAFAALFWRRLFFSGLVPFDVDTLCFYFPNWSVGRRLLEEGALLWDPYRNFGQPYLAVPQDQALYPLRFLSPFLSFSAFTKLSVAFHTTLSAVFAYRLAIRRGAGPAGACVGALTFTFAGAFFMRVVFSADFSTIAWLPCLLFLLETRRPLWLAAALALQWFAGYPPIFLVSLTVLAAVAATDADRRGAGRTLLAAVPLAAVLSAVQALPFLEMLRASSRDVLLGAAEALENSSHPIDVLRGLFWPSALHDVFPRPVFYRPMFYLGPFVTSLAIFGAVKGRREDRLLLGAAAVFFFLALGRFNGITEHLPFLRVFRYQGNWTVGGAACLALLAARGVSRLPMPRAQWFAVAAVAVDLLVFAWPLRHAVGDQTFITTIETRMPGFDRRPTGRVLHAEALIESYPDWNWRTENSWPLLKAVLLPSYGAAFGLREGASHHNLASREAQALRRRLNYGKLDPHLFDVADIARVVTITPEGLKDDLPGLERFGVVLNDNHFGRAFVIAGSSSPVRVTVDKPGRLGAQAQGPGKFVFSEGIAAGWRATVDGKTVVVEAYEDALMSVPLEAGPHDVEFIYAPGSFTSGAAVSLFGVGLLGFLAARRRVRPDAR